MATRFWKTASLKATIPLLQASAKVFLEGSKDSTLALLKETVKAERESTRADKENNSEGWRQWIANALKKVAAAAHAWTNAANEEVKLLVVFGSFSSPPKRR